MSDEKKDLEKEKGAVSKTQTEKPVLVQFLGPHKNYVAGDITGVAPALAQLLVDKKLASLYTAE